MKTIKNMGHSLHFYSLKLFFVLPEFRAATVSYRLDSATVPLNEVFFPSVVVCNMNTLRRSFIQSLVKDEKLKSVNVTYSELKKIVQLVFIEGEDLQLTPRENEVIDSKPTISTVFTIIKVHDTKIFL